ncbi:MAG: SDR family oxidoreductase [Holophagales bacterium]|nr:SDR family oxidoreductase [Holophagales bacterium]MYG31979.1 SDR family oxidoreductase [Holophagales bacterium]MYI79050.1 SDR family oxidoreductase [Holophagales bacterium]
MGKLEGKIALVTGGGTGIGRATALLFAREGASIIVSGRRLEPLEAVVSEIEAAGGNAWAHSADMEDPEAVRGLAAAILERHATVDVLVHNAGHSSKVRSTRYISQEEWDSVMAVNATGPAMLTKALLPAMLDHGGATVIMVSSMAAIRPGVMAGTAYGAAKAASRNYIMGLGAELRQLGIRATSVLPGEVDTPILDNRPRPPSEEERAGMMASEDIAEAILAAAALPERTVIEEMTLMPTRLRDYSADIAAARTLGAPEED